MTRYENKSATKNEKITCGVCLTMLGILLMFVLLPAIQTVYESRYYVEFTSPEIEKLEIYLGVYNNPKSLTIYLNPVLYLNKTLLDMRNDYQVLVYEKLIFNNGTFTWFKHERFVFDYMSLTENGNKAFIPLIDTNLTINILT